MHLKGFERLIKNKEKVEGLYGYWPSFHDAEIISINAIRSNAGENTTAKVIVELNYWNTKTVNEGTAEFNYVKENDSIITLEFCDVWNFETEGFNHQNVIDQLNINSIGSGLEVEFESIFGAYIKLTC